MEALLEELRSLFLKVQAKWNELEKLSFILNQKNEDITSKIEGHQDALNDLQKRETLVKDIENIEITRIQNQRDRELINSERSELQKQREDFEVYKNSQLSEIAREKEVIFNSWKEINAKEKNFEIELSKKVEEFLSKLKR